MTDRENDDAYFDNLVRVFQINQNNPNILLKLAEVLLTKNEHERAENLAKHGLEIVQSITQKEEKNQDIKLLHSNLLVLLGKIVHSKEDYNKAFKYYDEAVSVCDSNSVAIHYLGVMNLYLKNYNEAEKNFEKVLSLTKVEQDQMSEYLTVNVETMKILAQTKARMFKREEAIALLDKILENNKYDIECYLLTAHLTEQYDYEKAIKCYLKAIELLEKETQKSRGSKNEYTEEDYVNPIYYNNLAVLYMKMEQRDEANECLAKAREALINVQKLSPESMRLKAISVTMNFNEACQFEALGNIGEATNIYKHIINSQKREEPHYVDAYLRLAILAKQRGGIAKAIEYAEKAVRYQIDKKPIVPH